MWFLRYATGQKDMLIVIPRTPFEDGVMSIQRTKIIINDTENYFFKLQSAFLPRDAMHPRY